MGCAVRCTRERRFCGLRPFAVELGPSRRARAGTREPGGVSRSRGRTHPRTRVGTRTLARAATHAETPRARTHTDTRVRECTCTHTATDTDSRRHTRAPSRDTRTAAPVPGPGPHGGAARPRRNGALPGANERGPAGCGLRSPVPGRGGGTGPHDSLPPTRRAPWSGVSVCARPSLCLCAWPRVRADGRTDTCLQSLSALRLGLPASRAGAGGWGGGQGRPAACAGGRVGFRWR